MIVCCKACILIVRSLCLGTEKLDTTAGAVVNSVCFYALVFSKVERQSPPRVGNHLPLSRKQAFTRNRLVCHENKNPSFIKVNSFDTKASVDRVSCQLKFNATESNSVELSAEMVVVNFTVIKL